jgi:hypothetical protein
MSQPSPAPNPSRESAVSNRKTDGLPALGRAIMAAKKGNHSFVMMSLEAALAIHAITKVIHKNSYQRAYQKRYRAFKKVRLKARV